jgi:hypothetical protein
VNAIAVVEDEVRELVRRRGLDPVADPAAVRRLVDEVIAEYDDRSLTGSLPQLVDLRSAARQVFDAVAGFGPLQKYLDDPTVEEIWVNEPTKVFIARHGVHELTTTILTADEVRDLVEKMLKSSGRRVDLSTPFVDAMLPDGSRLHVTIPDITRQHWSVNIRKFVVRATHLEDLVQLGTLTGQAARFLEAAVTSGLNVLVAGGTQAGKATRAEYTPSAPSAAPAALLGSRLEEGTTHALAGHRDDRGVAARARADAPGRKNRVGNARGGGVCRSKGRQLQRHAASSTAVDDREGVPAGRNLRGHRRNPGRAAQVA